MGLIVVNLTALFSFDPLYIGAFLSFFYIVLVPGFLLLPFLVYKRLPMVLGLAISMALSVLIVMMVGLAVNTALPFFGIAAPLTTVPLLVAFDILIYVLLMLNFIFRKTSPIELPSFNGRSLRMLSVSALLPIFACMGAISLNNGGSNFFAMGTYALAFFLIIAVLAAQDNLNSSVPAITLYMMGLAFLLMNSMRGWTLSGHDVLLEYHVFSLVSNARLWTMSLYQDPYMACLSLTILPIYLKDLLRVSGIYIFKFFFQLISAAGVVVVYYLSKEYVSRTVAFLAGLLYITFPTYMTDMAFLNRQGIAFLFFGALIFILLTTEHFSGWRRTTALFLLGTGMVFSHYSTSYIAIAVLAGAYIINRIFRLAMNARRPRWFARFTGMFKNKEIYSAPILITLPFVIGLLCIVIVWSVVITKTSNTLTTTITSIATDLAAPFGSDSHLGVDQYSIAQTSQPSPQALLDQFVQETTAYAYGATDISQFFSSSTIASYPITLSSEPLVPLGGFGQKIQAATRISLTNFYNDIKQWYAYILQLLLLMGIVGFGVGYAFKKNLLRNVPAEYIALSLSGVAVLVAQTILPSSAINYGLLRLFQQNLIFLALPITLGLIAVIAVFFRSQKKRLIAAGTVLLFFFVILSGLLPELTGGGRAALPLNDYGFYYDAYYGHTQEIGSIDWLGANRNPAFPVQAALYFSGVKILAFANLGTLTGLLPSTIQKNSYVYLNYTNVKTGNVIQYIDGAVVYYQFPLNFLQDNKNLIYNNGGSEIYQ
ncbi:MAG TPA: DUF2206 domain-containing protein [Candidatus Paceibacterota bacterium]|nr:DUF2206 domain-containing protein [Candidatus Paceibacterota bacterium]